MPRPIRPELESPPPRLRRLPVDDRGYPVPWFVQWIDGRPEFRMMDQQKWLRAVRERLCWVCGGPLGVHLAFLVGPMCGINRTTAEPPGHRECAEWSARNCPFMSRPKMVRREDALTDSCRDNSAGLPLLRNPGVALVWNTLSYRVFDDGSGRPLIQMGNPESVTWWCEGRTATRDEVLSSVDSGFPSLMELAEAQGSDAVADLRAKRTVFENYLPAAQGRADG